MSPLEKYRRRSPDRAVPREQRTFDRATKCVRRPRADGFSLVELAIVLLIMGLLIGAFLKGQQLHDSARVHNVMATVASVQTAYMGFVDRYRKVPGDWGA